MSVLNPIIKQSGGEAPPNAVYIPLFNLYTGHSVDYTAVNSVNLNSIKQFIYKRGTSRKKW